MSKPDKLQNNSQFYKMLNSNEKVVIRWDLSYQLDSSSTVKADRSEYESMIVEKEQAKDFLKSLEIEDRKRHQSSRLNLKQNSPISKKPSSVSYKMRDNDNGFYFSLQKLQIPRALSSLLNSNAKCPDLATSDLLNSVYGAFFGFLIGDSIGSHIAFQVTNIDEHVPNALYMNGGGTYNLNPGQVTDDSELAFSLGYGLIEGAGTYDPDLIAKHYGLWLKSKPFDISALVAIVLNGLRKVELSSNMRRQKTEGLSDKIRKLAQKNINQQSNVGLVRVLPLAIWSMNLTEEQTQDVVRLQMQMIDANDLVVETAILWVKALHVLFHKRDHEQAYYIVSKYVYDFGSQELLALWQVIQRGHIIPSKGNLGRLKTSFTYAFIELNQPKLNFTDTLIEVLRKGGDTDSNAAIVCSLIGAAVGYTGIPSYFRSKVLNASVQTGKIRPPEFSPNRVLDIVKNLVELAPPTLKLS